MALPFEFRVAPPIVLISFCTSMSPLILQSFLILIYSAVPGSETRTIILKELLVIFHHSMKISTCTLFGVCSRYVLISKSVEILHFQVPIWKVLYIIMEILGV